MLKPEIPHFSDYWVHPNSFLFCFFQLSADTIMPAKNAGVNPLAALFEKNIPTMKKTGRGAGDNRQGSQAGWIKQGVQVPDHLALQFRDDASSLGYGGVKYLGAAAIAIVTGMNRKQQRAVANYVRDKTWSDPAHLEPARVLHMIGMFNESPYDLIPQYLQSTNVDISYDKAYEVWTKRNDEQRDPPSVIEAAREIHAQRETNRESPSDDDS